MRKFRELEIWKRSVQFCTELYKATDNFPSREKFGLTSQLRRAAVSIPSNIAEGCSRNSNKDFCRFLEILIGSAYELKTQLVIAAELKYFNRELSDCLFTKLHDIIRMTAKYQSTIKSSL